jgi:hypothetical protein
MTLASLTRRAARAALAHRPFEDDDDDDDERPIGDPDDDDDVEEDDDDDDEEPMQLAACSARPVGRAACRRGQ